MMSVWTHRPQLLHLGLFFAAYVLGCGFAQALAIVPGITVSIWPPGGVFIATLILTSPYTWPWWILAGCLAEMFAQFVWFHSPLPAGFLIYVGNALGAAVGAALVNRTCGRPVRLETLQEVLAFVVLGAGVGPLVSATVGSATLAWFGVESQTFTAVWPLFWIGDATGILLVAPLTLVVIQYWRRKAELPPAQRMEAGVLGLTFLGVAALSLSNVYLPTPYIIMPPLLWAAARFEFRGAAVALTLLALITMALTISGDSQFVGDPESQRERQVMLQLFLAISAFSALIVAAISRQRQLALVTSRDRERELSQLVDMVPSHVWRLAPDGEPIFFNKRMVDFLGLDVADTVKPGMSRLEAMIEAVHSDDAAAFGHTLRHCLATGDVFAMRYRLRHVDGSYRWMSSRAEPMRDGVGRIVQWYGLCHDIDDQMHAEEALRRSERQLQEMIDAVPVRIWSAKPAGGPIYFNKRYQDHLRSVIANFDSFGEPRIDKLLQELIHPDDAPEVQDTLRNCFETGGASTMRFRWREEDGAYRWAECRMEARRGEDGEIAEWYGVSLDVDDEVRAQEALQERERELSQLVDMVPVQISRLTPEGDPTFFNKRLLDFLGLNDAAQLEKPDMSRLAAAIQTLIHPQDATRLLETVHRSFATGEPYSMKYRIRRADGAYRWVDGRGEPMRDQSGAIVQWYAISIDIDDEMRLYRDIEEREAKIRRLVDSDIIGIVIWDLDGRLIEANDAFLRMIQYEREDLQAGLRWFDMTPPEWQQVHARDEAEELEATGKMQAREKEYFRKDGSRVPVLIGAACFEGQSRQGVAYILDLTESKRAEAALRNRERQLQQLIDTVPVQIWCVSPGGEPAYINKTMMDYIGMKLGDFDAEGGLPSAIETIVHPDDRAALLQALTHSFDTGEPFALKFRNRRWDGQYRWTDGRAEPLRDDSGRIIRWYGANVDIDDMVTAQEALRQSERSLQQVIDTVPVLIFLATPAGDPIYANKRLADFHGFQQEEFDAPGETRMDRSVHVLVHPDDRPAVHQALKQSFSSGEPFAMRYRQRRYDGVYRWIEGRAEPLRNENGDIVQWYGVNLDVDEEVRAQEALRQASDKLAQAAQAASLAELSASIAHEVNQPLAAIVANSHACHRWLSAAPPNVERAKITAERIIRDANSAADVVSRIRALFRQSVEPANKTELSSVIAEMRNLMAEEATRRRIRMDVDVENSLPLVALDRIQVQQVLINLIRNGMEAMDSASGDRVLGIRVRRMGDAVQTEVSDRGAGIEFPDKIFEPFFTTKWNGMGMGLAICRSIVESHGGRLWAEKNEPQGATFIFTLPVEVKAAA